MPRSAGCRTLVLGAGLAGSVSALMCARAGHDVLLVERDAATVGVRPGAPQGQQLHNLLGRAQLHLSELLPGFGAAFDAQGGQRARVASQTHVFELGVDMPERDLGLEIWSSPKSLVDSVVEQSVRAADVRRRLGARAEGLIIAGGRVVGAVVDGATVEADLVIDAMGARSPASRWLPSPVPVDEYVVRQWYTTMPVRRPSSMMDIPDFWLTFPTYPRMRGGLVSPIDASMWSVSLSGGPEDPVPRTPEAFLAYAGTLEHPRVRELVAAGIPTAPPHVFGKPVASWRRFDRGLASGTPVPGGLLSVGDAVADLNPLSGQGISVMVWELSALGALLDDLDDLDEIAARYWPSAAAAVGAAWDVTTLYDPGVGDVTLSEAQYADVIDAVRSDPVAHRRYVEVWHLLRPARELAEIIQPEGVAP